MKRRACAAGLREVGPFGRDEGRAIAAISPEQMVQRLPAARSWGEGRGGKDRDGEKRSGRPRLSFPSQIIIVTSFADCLTIRVRGIGRHYLFR